MSIAMHGDALRLAESIDLHGIFYRAHATAVIARLIAA